MFHRSFAQLYAWVVGVAMLVVAFIGLMTNSSLQTGSAVEQAQSIGLTFNGWYVLLYAVTAAVLLMASGRLEWVRGATLLTGIVYLLLALVGLAFDTNVILSVLPVTSTDSIFHLVIGAVGVLAGTSTVAVEEHRGPVV